MMKIAFFNHTLRLVSGIDTVITELASRLIRHDEVTVYCFKSNYNKEEYEFEIKEIKSVWSTTQNRMSVIAPFIMDKIGHLMPLLEKYDVINTHNFPAIYLARNLKKPFKSEWTVGDPKPWPSSLKQRLYIKWLVCRGNRAAARKADPFLASSQFIKRWTIEHYSLEPHLIHEC